MMMDRAHFKHPFSGQFKTCDLNDNRKFFTNVNNPDWDKQHRQSNAHTQRDDHAAQKHRAQVAHKAFCRIEIPDKEAQAGACQSGGKNRHIIKAVNRRNNHIHNGDYKSNRRGKAVNSIGQIHRIDKAYDSDHDQRIIEEAKIHLTQQRENHNR